MQLSKFIIILTLFFSITPSISAAQDKSDPNEVLLYRTPEERRDAGIKYELTDWLTAAGLIELEYETERLSLRDSPKHSYQDQKSGTIQAALEANPTDWFLGEFVYEYELNTGDHLVEEAVAIIEIENLGFEFGKMEVPFGEYYSYFIRGPILEFGETRGTGGVISYDFDDAAEISAFIYEGRSKQLNSTYDNLDWGLALESKALPWGTTGISFISDLADSTEDFLIDQGFKHKKRVPAISAFTTTSFKSFDLTIEYVGAIKSFEDLDNKVNNPKAWNFEIARNITDEVLIAYRLEGSKELEDTPKLSTGLSFSWRANEHLLISLDCLHDWYDRGLANDTNEREISKGYTVIGQISFGL